MADQFLSSGLRDALGKGAEIGLARALAAGESIQTVRDYISARLGDLDTPDVNYLIDLARSILTAGDYVSGLQDDEEIDPSQIPTVPIINEDEWSGKRVRWFGEWSTDEGETWFQFSGTLPDITDYGDIVAYAFNLANSYIEAYPGKFEGITGEPIGDVRVKVLGQEKAF